MSYITWPDALNKQTQVSWHLEGSSMSSGVGLDGREQVVFRENRRWVGSVSIAPLVGADAALAKSIISQLRGRSGVLDMPVPNHYSQYTEGGVAVDAADQAAGYMSFSDGTTYTDGTGHELPDLTIPRVTANVAPDATTLTIDSAVASDIRPGVYFSYMGFLYIVESISSGTVTFAPAARSAISNGMALRFGSPTIRCRLSDDSTGRIIDMPGGYSVLDGSLELVEVFDR